MLDPFADKLTQGSGGALPGHQIPRDLSVLLIFIVKGAGDALLCHHSFEKEKTALCGHVVRGGGDSNVLSFRFRHSDYGWLFSGKDPGVRCCINILLLLTAVMMLYSAFKYFQIFREILHSDDEKYELDLPDEIRAKTVREKTRRNK